MNDAPKPQCKVRGLIARGMMCGHIIVGGNGCGFTGNCEHKITPAAELARSNERQLGKMKGEK